MIFEGTKNQFFFGLGLTRAGKVIPKQAQLEMMCKIYDIPVDNIFLPIKSTLS